MTILPLYSKAHTTIAEHLEASGRLMFYSVIDSPTVKTVTESVFCKASVLLFPNAYMLFLSRQS